MVQLTLFEWISGISFGIAAVVGFAYWLFKNFSEKWLTAKFNERLEDHKHAQQKELENVRFEFNKLMDRTVKLHQREFDVLPEVWTLLVDAYGTALSATSQLQEYDDLSRMKDEEFRAFLANIKLFDWQKAEIVKSDNRTNTYIAFMRERKLNEAFIKFIEYNNYRLKIGVFLTPEIDKKFEYVSNVIHGALEELKYEISEDDTVSSARVEFYKNGPDLIKDLEGAIRDRLWSNWPQESQQ